MLDFKVELLNHPSELIIADYIKGRELLRRTVISEYPSKYYDDFKNREVFREFIHLELKYQAMDTEHDNLDEIGSWRFLQFYTSLPHVVAFFTALQNTRRYSVKSQVIDSYCFSRRDVHEIWDTNYYDWMVNNAREIFWRQYDAGDRTVDPSGERYLRLEKYLTGLVWISNGYGYVYKDYTSLNMKTFEMAQIYGPDDEVNNAVMLEIIEIKLAEISQAAQTGNRPSQKRKIDTLSKSASPRPAAQQVVTRRDNPNLINTVPMEILVPILDSIQRWADIVSLASTSRHFRSIIKSYADILAEEIIKRKYPGVYAQRESLQITSWPSFALGIDYSYLRYTDTSQIKVEAIEKFYAVPIKNEIIYESHRKIYPFVIGQLNPYQKVSK